MIVFLLLANLGCASERLYVKVVDDEGVPVSSATVNVDFSMSYGVFGEGTARHYEARTDAKGNAVVKFNCMTSDFGWHVEREGYYRGESKIEHFKGEDVIIPPAFAIVRLHEHEKRGETVLYRKKNPQPMYAYTRDVNIKSPIANGLYGFDLERFDWLPPRVEEAVFNPRPNDPNLEFDTDNNLATSDPCNWYP